jgi:hypothetical protein
VINPDADNIVFTRGITARQKKASAIAKLRTNQLDGTSSMALLLRIIAITAIFCRRPIIPINTKRNRIISYSGSVNICGLFEEFEWEKLPPFDILFPNWLCILKKTRLKNI